MIEFRVKMRADQCMTIAQLVDWAIFEMGQRLSDQSSNRVAHKIDALALSMTRSKLEELQTLFKDFVVK